MRSHSRLSRLGQRFLRQVRLFGFWRWRGPKSRTALCREGFYYLLVLAFVFTAALLADMNLLMVLAGMMVGPVWISHRLVAATLRGLRVQRKMPGEICAGDMLVVSLMLSNNRRKLGTWALVAEDRVQKQTSSHRERTVRTSVFFPYVPFGQQRERVYRGRINDRGRYRFGPLKISTRFPFGFFRRVVAIDEAGWLTVCPRLGRLTRQWRARHHQSFEGAQRPEPRHGGTSGDFYGVRPWRDGDSRRHIHWRSSARRGMLVVRQFDQQRNRDLAVLVELWQPEAPTKEQLENVELAVSFAATVIAEACRKGDSDLVIGTTAGPNPCLRGPASAALLHDALTALAVAEAEPRDGLPELLEFALKQCDRGTEVVLISTRPVDLTDADRFGLVSVEPAQQAMLGRIRTVNAADAGLSQYFEVE